MYTSYAQIVETNEIIMNTTMLVIVMSGYLVFCSAVVININEISRVIVLYRSGN